MINRFPVIKHQHVYRSERNSEKSGRPFWTENPWPASEKSKKQIHIILLRLQYQPLQIFYGLISTVKNDEGQAGWMIKK
jgi:hypothetical protein